MASRPRAGSGGRLMAGDALGWWGVPLAVGAGAIRVSTPFLFVSLGEVVTETSGRINLGLEGTLVMGAMSGYAISYLTGSPWLGVLVAGLVGAALGALHAGICSLPRVNDIAVGIALMLFGTGAAFFLGTPFVAPHAPSLPSIPLGFWSGVPQIQAALQVNVLFFIGVAAAPALAWALRNTGIGMMVRMVGDNAEAARAMGYSPLLVGCMRPCSAASWPASAGRSSRFTIPEAGARACPPARASSPSHW